jgi:hypothetical protein
LNSRPCDVPNTLQVSKGGKRAFTTAFAGNKKKKFTTKESLADLSDVEDLAVTANQASLTRGLPTSRPSRNIRRKRFFEESDSE